MCPDCPDPSTAQQGDAYTIDNGSVYIFNNGEWEREIEELDEVVVTGDAPNSAVSDNAFIPVGSAPIGDIVIPPQEHPKAP